MLGLIYGGGALLYLLLIFVVVGSAWKIGYTNSKSLNRGVFFALVGALVMCIPPLFSVLPILLAHQESCALDAGYQEFVSSTQWAAKHPNLIQQLRGVNLTKITKNGEVSNGFSRDIDFSGMRARDRSITKATKWGVEVIRVELRIVDAIDNALLARSIDYSTGSQDDALFWRNRMSCFPQSETPVIKLNHYSYEMTKAIK